MLHISPNTIEVWCCFFDEIREIILIEKYRQLLSHQEQHQERRFYFPKDRHRYLVTRTLVRTVLSRYVDIDPSHWKFSVNAYGKPEISSYHQLRNRLTFNISHTDGLIVMAVAYGNALGVDAENLRTRPAPIDVVGRFFSVDETTELRTLPREAQHRRFFQYWTLKESYIKARGLGLSIPLDQFSFLFLPNKKIDIRIQPTLGDDDYRWYFWQFNPSPEHLIAICAERGAGQNQRILIRKVIPLEIEEMHPCPLLGESN